MEDLIKISEFSRLSGISRKTLIHYDKIDLLKPTKVDPSSGYRYYSYRLLDVASVILVLRMIDLSLNEIKDYLSNTNPKNLISTLKLQELKMDSAIKKLLQTKEQLQIKIKQTELGLNTELGKIRKARLYKENLFIGNSIPSDRLNNFSWEFITEFYDLCEKAGIPFGFPEGALISKERLLNRQFAHNNYYVKLPFSNFPIYHEKEEGNFLILSEKASYGNTEPIYEKMLAYIANNRLEIVGNAYEEMLLDEISTKNSDDYVVQVSIEIQ